MPDGITPSGSEVIAFCEIEVTAMLMYCGVVPAETEGAVQSLSTTLSTVAGSLPIVTTESVSSSSLPVNATVTVFPSFAHAVPSFTLFDEIETEVRIGAMPSTTVRPYSCGLQLPFKSFKPDTPSPCTVTSGVSPVPIAVPRVSVTTPLDSDVAVTSLTVSPSMSTKKSAELSEEPSRSSLNVTSIDVVVMVSAESGTGPATSTDISENTAIVFPARSFATLP